MKKRPLRRDFWSRVPLSKLSCATEIVLHGGVWWSLPTRCVRARLPCARSCVGSCEVPGTWWQAPGTCYQVPEHLFGSSECQVGVFDQLFVLDFGRFDVFKEFHVGKIWHRPINYWITVI